MFRLVITKHGRYQLSLAVLRPLTNINMDDGNTALIMSDSLIADVSLCGG